MRRIVLTQKLVKLTLHFEERPVQWTNAEFIPEPDFSATINVWEDGVEPEQMWSRREELRARARSFMMALKCMGNLSAVQSGDDLFTYYFDGWQFSPRSEHTAGIMIDYLRGRRADFTAIDTEMSSLRITWNIRQPVVPAPTAMPVIPAHLHGFVETLVAAETVLHQHPDLAPKLAYIVLEYLEDPPPEDLRYVRNFVSHPICGDPSVVAYVVDRLPTAQVDEGVQFRRDQIDHRSFVETHADSAMSRTRDLFKRKVLDNGGYLP